MAKQVIKDTIHWEFDAVKNAEGLYEVEAVMGASVVSDDLTAYRKHTIPINSTVVTQLRNLTKTVGIPSFEKQEGII